MAGLSKVDRHHRILEVLSADKRALLPELEDVIDASRITIQRDLAELEGMGLLRRFHGGAMLAEYDVTPQAHAIRMAKNLDAKRRIAHHAARQIQANTFVAVDASSTMYHLASAPLPHGLTIVTSGLDTFVELHRVQPQNGTVAILSGGKLQAETHTLVGSDALQTISSYHYEVFLFSAYSVVPGQGIFEYSEENAAVKRAFAQRSERLVLAMDKSKNDNRGGVKVCDVEDIDLFITDGAPQASLKSTMGEKIAVI